MNQANNSLQKFLTNSESIKVLLFLLFGFGILAVSIMFFTLSLGKPYMGVGLSLNDGVWGVVTEDANGPASLAGIKEGDRPLEINGQPAEIFLDKYENAGAVMGRLINEITVVDQQGQLKSAALKDSVISWQYLVAQIAWLIVCIIFWIIGFYVFLRRRKSTAARLLCLCGLVFGLVLSGNMAADTGFATAFWFEVAATLIAPWLLLHFFLALPREGTKQGNIHFPYLIYLPAVITLVLVPLVGYADGQSLPWFRSVRMFEIGIGFSAALSVAVFNYFRAGSPRTRQQMKIILIGGIAALIPLVFLNMLPEALWRQPIIPSGYSILLFVIIPLSMGYAVITQRLMDIDLLIRRGMIYLLVSLVLAAVLSGAIFLSLAYRNFLGVAEEILIALGLGVIASVLFGPTKKGVERMIDRLFYKDRYDYRKLIQSLSGSLNLVKEPTEISRLIVGTTVNSLNLAGGCLLFKGHSGSFQVSAAQGTFSDTVKVNQLLALAAEHSRTIEFPNSASTVCADVAFLIPLLAGEKEIGVLCLSHKISRQVFSSDDIYLLQGVSSVAAMALHRALLIHDVSIRDTFVSVASHELRTPLTSIVGYAELMLRREAPDVTKKEWLKNILDNSQRLSTMVDDLLNVTRIYTGKASFKVEEVSLHELFAETTALIRESPEGHKIIVDIEPNLPKARLDRDKFAQVIANLLSNAIKYSPNGGRITLSARNDPERHRVIISVADQGIGIGPEDKGELFTTFHRISRPETQGIRGSGLGLYIAKEWTEAMGGEIWLESELDKGSTFFVAIPTQVSSETCR